MDGVAIGNGILTVENEAQALTRAKPDEKDKETLKQFSEANRKAKEKKQP